MIVKYSLSLQLCWQDFRGGEGDRYMVRLFFFDE